MSKTIIAATALLALASTGASAAPGLGGVSLGFSALRGIHQFQRVFPPNPQRTYEMRQRTYNNFQRYYGQNWPSQYMRIPGPPRR